MAKAKVEFEFVPLDDRLKKSLKENQDIAKQTEKDAQKAATSVGQLLSAATAGLAGAKVIGFFKEAVASANRLEQSLARVESAARAFGQSTTKAKEAAQDLAKDGFLSLNQSASSLSNLMATGLNVEQSKKFITAAKDISAFGNTIGDAAESVESGIKGILTGSSELVENMSPKMKTLSMRFTENKNKVGEAKAAQILYNDVLKLGTQFQGDAAKYLDTAAAAQKRYDAATERTAATIGTKLQPLYKTFYNTLATVIDKVQSFISGMSATSVSLGALAAVAPVVGFAIAKLGATIGLSFTAALGPIGLVVAAIAGLGMVLTMNMKTQKERQEELNQSYRSTKSELAGLFGKIENLSKQNKRTADQERELALSKEALRKKAKELGVDYDNLALKITNVGDQLKYLDKVAKQQLADKANAPIERGLNILENRREQYNEAIASREREIQKQKDMVKTGQISKEMADKNIEYYRQQSKFYIEAEKQLSKEIIAERNKRVKVEEDEIKPPSAGGDSARIDGAVQRFAEIQERFKEIEKNRRYTLAKLESDLVEDGFKKGTALYKKELERRREAAAQNAKDLQVLEIANARQAIAEYIEDEAEAKHEANKKEFIQAKDIEEALYNRQLIEAQGNLEKIAQAEAEHKERQHRINLAYAIKEARVYTESLTQSLAGGAGIANALKKLQSGDASGAGDLLTGAGGFGKGLQGLGLFKGSAATSLISGAAMFGPVLGGVTSLISGLSNLFGKSDAERQKEADDQRKRDEEAKKLLEIQAEYQKRMLNIQEANAKLPFENLQRQLRLIDIKAQQAELAGASPEQAAKERLAARNAAIQGTINSQSGTIGQGELFKGFTPTAESLTNLLSTTAGQGPSTDAYLQYAAQALGDVGSIQQLAQLRQQMEALAGSVPKEIVDASLPTVRDKERNFWTLYNQMHAGDYGARSSKEQREKFLAEMLKADYATSGNVTKFSADVATRTSGSSVAARVGNLGAEFKNDVSVAENLISVIEQGNQTQLEIAKNTKETAQALTLEKDRSAAFIDIAGGGIRGFGQLLAGTYGLNSNALQIPKGLSNAMLASVGTKSLEQQGVEAMQKMLAVNMDMRELLAEIAINTNRGFGDVSGSLSESDLLTKLQSFKDRS